MEQALTIDDLRRQFSGPENRNNPNKESIESTLLPFTEGNESVYLTQGGNIVSSNSPEMTELKRTNPNIDHVMQNVKDKQRDY
jgi:hypothetical protein